MSSEDALLEQTKWQLVILRSEAKWKKTKTQTEWSKFDLKNEVFYGQLRETCGLRENCN